MSNKPKICRKCGKECHGRLCRECFLNKKLIRKGARNPVSTLKRRDVYWDY